MSDEPSATINLQGTMPLVQSSSSMNKSTGNNKSQVSTPQTPTTNMSASSFIVGTKANQSIISDTPVIDTGANSNKQVIITFFTIVIFIQNHRNQEPGTRNQEPLL